MSRTSRASDPVSGASAPSDPGGVIDDVHQSTNTLIKLISDSNGGPPSPPPGYP